MRLLFTVLAVTGLAGAVLAQTATTPQPATGGPADQPPAGAAEGGATALEPGANSFTEGQARERLEEAGLAKVSELAKDDQGIWRAKARRDGKPVSVGLDYKGNLAIQ